VATAFVPNPYNLPEVNHKDENRQNNEAINLEWCSSKYNNNYGNHGKNIAQATRMDIYSIDKNGNKEFFHGVREAGRILTGSENAYVHISEALNKKRKSAYGRCWFYV
jgi:hypothetical protein